MAKPQRHPTKIRVAPAWGASVIAGAGAGVVAGLTSAAAGTLMHGQALHQTQILGSAFIVGILGGILYGWLGRITRRPVMALWVITLADATTGSFLIALLPLVSGPHSLLSFPVIGAMAPLRPLIALVSVGRVGPHNFLPRSSLPGMVTLYLSAIAVSMLVPRWAKPKDR
ncbi:MAG TPA: hypothetical protein VJT32_00345 [bacterium]|nr:hypothetical protein [bacterium]